MSNPDPGVERRWTVVLLATFLLAAVLRFTGLQSGLWYDEIITLVESARHPIRQILTEFPSMIAHPLYSVLAHASLAEFGESAWALRLPACIFGVASVVMAYVLGRQLTTRVEAWAGSVVLATSYHHIWFSQNARGYTLLGFLTLVATYFLVRAERTGRVADYAVYALACAAGTYTHLTMVFVVAGHAGVMLAGRGFGWRPSLQQPLGPLVWAWAGAGVLSVAAYAPFMLRLVAIVDTDTPSGAVKVATTGWAIGEGIRSLLSGTGVPVALVAGLLAVCGALSVWRRHPLAVALLVVPGAVTVLAIAALRWPIRPRFLFFLSWAAVIFVGRGIGAAIEALAPARLKERPAALTPGIVAAALMLVAASAAGLPRNYRVPKQDFDGAVRFLDLAEAQGAQISASGPACRPLASYYGKTWGCLRSADDWGRIRARAERQLVVYTLAEYIKDPTLLEGLRTDCPLVRRFAGTLGGGDLVVCEAHPEERSQ